MWDTFIATLLANVAALAIFTIPAVAIWAFVKDRNHRARKFWSKQVSALTLKLRFGWLVLGGKRKKSEYRSWASSERTRKYMLQLVCDGDKARSFLMRSLGNTFSTAAAIFVDELYSKPPLDRLIETGWHLSLNDLCNPLESQLTPLPPDEMAGWLLSQTMGEIAAWSLRLNDYDRTVWKSWLESPKCVVQLESVRVSTGHP